MMSKLQTDSLFSNSSLVQLESKNHLVIYLEENDSLFFPGSYKTVTERSVLLEQAEMLAEAEGIFPDSHPISLNLLQDISGNRGQVVQTMIFYIIIDCIRILLLFLTGRWFVRRSLRPLEETYEKQQDFVTTASHELRSLLAVIQTTADVIAGALRESTRLLKVIRKECQMGSSLVKNLLLLAAADRNSLAVKKAHFEIDEMLLEPLEMYEPLCLSRGGDLLLELPDELISVVMANPELCRQIFTVLLDNAVAYGMWDVLAGEAGDTAMYEKAQYEQANVISEWECENVESCGNPCCNKEGGQQTADCSAG